MNRKPLPYPPQMRNADLLPSPPHFDPVDEAIRLVATACANLEALRVYDAINRAHQEDARRQQLLAEQAARARQDVKTLKRYLINYPYLCDYGQTIFCLSFPSRDRATAPGRCEYMVSFLIHPKRYAIRTL